MSSATCHVNGLMISGPGFEMGHEPTTLFYNLEWCILSTHTKAITYGTLSS